MDAVSALPSVTASNVLAGLTSSSAVDGTLTPDLSSTVAALSAQPSTQVLLSQFAQSVLAQQASDPTLNIDTAVATSLSSLLSTSGPLYTPSGQLQQFAGALLLTQTTPDTSATTSTQTQQVLADAALPATAPSAPVTTSSAQQLQDAANAAQQAFLTSQLTALDTASTDTQTIAPAPTTAAVTPATSTPANTTAVTTAADQLAASLTAAIAPATTDVAAADTTTNTAAATTTPTTATATVAPTPETTVATTAADVLPTTADVPDPYQQAALASGQSVFGKELNSFVPGAAEADVPAAVRAASAVRPVVPRRDEQEEASVNASA